jgi:ABC-type Mn2+/Zn2+ transport system permease subunit
LKMLGALLLSALIVMPAAAARIASNSFRMLIFGALLLGTIAPPIAPPIGIAASASFNLPTRPSIVLVHFAALALCQLLHLFRPVRRVHASSLLTR